MKPIGTAISYYQFRAWLERNGYERNEWNFIRSAAQLLWYRNVELTVVGDYPPYFSNPYGWDAVRAQMAAHGITERLMNEQ